MIEEAKILIQLNIPIIPLCPPDHSYMNQRHIERCHCPGKMPLIKDWQNKTSTTEEELLAWQRQFKKFNIGMPLGEASGYCGIDVDGDGGLAILMQMSNGVLPATWEFTTGNGTRLLYRIPEGLKTKKFKQSGDGIHEECALLCTGQQTVLPPSVHANGTTYQWVEGHSPKDLDCAEAPEWLINAIKIEDNNNGFRTASNSAPKKIMVPGFDFASEFRLENESFDEEDLTEAMDLDLPENVDIPDVKQGKSKKIVTVTEEMLTQPIPEGQRDNTMTAIVGHYCANRDMRRLGKDMILQVCLEHNRKYCQPPLDDQAIIDKVNFFYDVEMNKEVEFNSKGKAVFEASTVASNLIKHLNNQGILLRYDQFTHMYYYTLSDEGPWQCTHDTTLINRWIREVVTSPHYGDPSWDKRSYIEETRAALEERFTLPFKKVSDFDLGAHSEELCKYIVLKNGMLDWRTGKLIPWDPDYHTTISFNINYDAFAECPHWEQYLAEWLPDEQVRKVIQEFLGYCLIPNTSFRKAMFCYGKGRNGKSIFIEFLQEFFGPLCAKLSYDALFQRFGPANLKDKLVNIYDDTNITFTKDTGIAKNLITGGTIGAEFKGKDMFTFTNVARIIFSAQEMPRTADNSLAWYDRWIFVKFPNTFRTSNTKKAEMKENMRKEKAGIFNWMLEGLKRLMDQDEFSSSEQLQEYTQEYRSSNDNVIQFLSTYCQVVPDQPELRITTHQMYLIYEMFTEKDNLRKVSRKVFRTRLEDAGFPVATGRVGSAKGQTYFKGLGLNYESEEVLQNLVEIRVILTQG